MHFLSFQPIDFGMAEWVPYIMEVQTVGVDRVMVVRLDGEKYVMSPELVYDSTETSQIYQKLAKNADPKSLSVQGEEYRVTSKQDMVIVAETTDQGRRALLLCASKSRQFVVIGISDRTTDTGQCHKEISRLTQHIRQQGL